MAYNPNTLKKAELVQKMVAEFYEPGNQRRSKIQAFRQHVSKVYPMGTTTFWRLMSMKKQEEDKRQLTIDF